MPAAEMASGHFFVYGILRIGAMAASPVLTRKTEVRFLHSQFFRTVAHAVWEQTANL